MGDGEEPRWEKSLAGSFDLICGNVTSQRQPFSNGTMIFHPAREAPPDATKILARRCTKNMFRLLYMIHHESIRCVLRDGLYSLRDLVSIFRYD